MPKTSSPRAPKPGAKAATSGTRNFLRRQLWIWPLIAGAMLAFVGFWVRARMERAIRAEITANLLVVRDANVEALRAWATAMKSQTELLAGNEQVRALTLSLLHRSSQQGAAPGTWVNTPEFLALRTHLKPAEEGRGFGGYAVLDTNFVVISAGRDQFVGTQSPQAYAERLAPCLAGETIVTPPFATAGMVPDESGQLRPGGPVMFAAAPILSTEGQAVAVLGLRILPERDFTRILSTARSGATAETYAFNRDGVLVSQSRFDEDLKQMGLIPDSPDARSLLTLDLRDPAVDLTKDGRPPKRRSELPLIKPVREALAGRDGSDAQGYRDYRGIPAVGAWAWLPEFGIGLVAEVDVAEALTPLRAVRAAFWIVFGFLAILSAVVFVYMRLAGRFHEKAQLAALEAKQLGQYALDEEIGSGGFGIVFRAHHALMRRPVAVKVLSPIADERTVARFEREVQITCQLTHPNTIALYDYGRTDDGLFYYAMEYLEGLSLDGLVNQYGPQPEARVIHILRQACSSLAEAHSRGLVHRDIKPQNIFLTHRGGIPDFVKVLDFGLVKARDTEPQLDLTAVHATVGTPLYMSPEAVKGAEAVDALSDIYSLGCVGYQLLTGETVFSATSVAELLLKQLHETPDTPSARLKRPVAADLEDVIMRCLAKTPSARPTGAAALDDALAFCRSSGAWSRRDAHEWWQKHTALQSGKTQTLPRAKAGTNVH